MKVHRRTTGNKLLARRKKQIFQATTVGVRDGHQDMARRCPVDQGDLRSTTTMEDDEAGHASLGTGGKSNISDRHVSHHIYIEYGTRKMAAQPYYRPGLDTAKQSLRRRYRAIK